MFVLDYELAVVYIILKMWQKKKIKILIYFAVLLLFVDIALRFSVNYLHISI